jgi:cardiolipin synthase
MPPRPLLDALCAACRHGVDVRLLLPGNGAAWPALATARAQYTSLLKAGAHLFELPDTALYARTAVVDDEWAAVGSSSIDWSKVAPRTSIDVIALDAGLAAQLESAFRDDQAISRAITPEHWAQRSLMLRLQEFTARRLELIP